MTHDAEATPLGDVLGRLAIAKHALGYRGAYWTARAPGLELKMALTGMALEEEGHAKVLEGFASERLGHPAVDRQSLVTWSAWPGQVAPGASPDEAWPDALMTYGAQDAAITVALAALADAAPAGLADRARKMLQEEEFHTLFVSEALAMLGSAEATRTLISRQVARANARAATLLDLRPRINAMADCGELPPEAAQRYARDLESLLRSDSPFVQRVVADA